MPELIDVFQQKFPNISIELEETSNEELHKNLLNGEIGLATIREANLHPPIKAKSDNIETLLALCLRGVGACFCQENLARATLSGEQMESLELIRLGERGKYQIRFGYLKQSYQWSIISEFIQTALKMLG